MDAEDTSATIALRSEQLRVAISRLMDAQDDIQEDILELQRRKRQGTPVDENQLEELKGARNAASDQISLLALTRSELFDDLPVIRIATGKVKVIAADLEKDATLLEQAGKKIKKATQVLGKAEKLLVKMIKLAGVIV